MNTSWCRERKRQRDDGWKVQGKDLGARQVEKDCSVLFSIGIMAPERWKERWGGGWVAARKDLRER